MVNALAGPNCARRFVLLALAGCGRAQLAAQRVTSDNPIRAIRQ